MLFLVKIKAGSGATTRLTRNQEGSNLLLQVSLETHDQELCVTLEPSQDPRLIECLIQQEER